VCSSDLELRTGTQAVRSRDWFLPVGKTCVAVVVDGWDKANRGSGLATVDGKGFSNETYIKGNRLVTGKSHVFDATVKWSGQDGTIHVDLDGKPVIRWTGRVNRLGMFPVWAVNDRSKFHVGTYATVVRLDSFQLRMLSGKATVDQPQNSESTTTGKTIFNLVEQFNKSQSPGPGSHWRKAEYDEKPAIEQHPLSNGVNDGVFEMTLPKQPAGSKLTFQFATAVNKNTQDGVRFLVYVNEKEVLSHVQKGGQAIPHKLDLSDLAGTKARIRLRIHCIASQAYDNSFWIEPLIVMIP